MSQPLSKILGKTETKQTCLLTGDINMASKAHLWGERG